MSYSPASYTLLGISLTLATLSLVGTGGVKWWYLKELSKADTDDRDGDDRDRVTSIQTAAGGLLSHGGDFLGWITADRQCVIELPQSRAATYCRYTFPYREGFDQCICTMTKRP